LLSPFLDLSGQTLKTGVVNLELLSSESADLVEHASEHLRCEAAILLCRKLAESTETVPLLDGKEVDEVARFRPSEHREHLVDCKLFPAQRGRWFPRFDGEQAGVRRQVNLGSIACALDEKSCEAGIVLYSPNAEAGCSQGMFHGWEEPVDGIVRQPEEVEILGLPLHVTTRDQRGATCESEIGCFLQARDDLGDCS
jgi:hypothetical protein